MNIPGKWRNYLHQSYKQQQLKKHNLQYLFLELSRKCNLNCLHCGSDCKHQNNNPELSLQSWLLILDYLKTTFNPLPAIILTGGEPLLYKHLLVVAEKLKQHNFRWGMVTNGLLLTPQLINRLINCNMQSVTVSLDGTENSHNWLRNSPVAYKKVLDGLQLLTQSNLVFTDVVTCVNPQNLTELSKIAETLITIGIRNWRLFRIFPSGRAEHNDNLVLSFDKTQQLLHWIKTHKPELKKRNLHVNLSCEGWIPVIDDVKVRDNLFFCRSGINVASILSDGTITGCSNNQSQFFQGNILTHDFALLWNNSFDNLRNRNWLSNTICANCEYLSTCNGGSAHLWHNNKIKPEFCYMNNLL